MNESIAALLGNGVSVAYNPDLRMDRIYSEIAARLNAGADDDRAEPIRLLQRVASRIDTGDATHDFEALLGPMEQYRDGIQMLAQLAELTGDGNRLLSSSMQVTGDYVELVRRTGVGHALDVIARRSKASMSSGPQVRDLLEELVGALGHGRLTIGNLNYDSLVMAALTSDFSSLFCDLTDGREPEREIDLAGFPAYGRPLRAAANFPTGRPIRMLHLHGSLSWLRDPDPSGTVWRFSLDGLRAADYWQAYRKGLTDWAPQVVLTNQASKISAITKYPYQLAYRGFELELGASDRWFICGYSFRDSCINEMLLRARRNRHRPARILVVTRGPLPSRRQVLAELGWNSRIDGDPARWVSVFDGGVEALARSEAWTNWQRAVALSEAS